MKYCLFCSAVVSGSRDASLRVWDIETGKCKQVLQGHIAAVRWQEAFACFVALSLAFVTLYTYM